MLQLREGEILKTLEALEGLEFVLIGGYAVNAYALPRFSVDCDIVVHGGRQDEIASLLKNLEYVDVETPDSLPYSGSFNRFEKAIERGFRVSVDLLVDKVWDRQTGAVFTAEWIFKNSKIRTLSGKTISERVKARIIDIGALFVMKAVSARSTDIRDVFMLAPYIGNREWVKAEIAERCQAGERLSIIAKTVNSKSFRDGLQGVYGQVDEKTFEKHRKAINRLSALF